MHNIVTSSEKFSFYLLLGFPHEGGTHLRILRQFHHALYGLEQCHLLLHRILLRRCFLFHFPVVLMIVRLLVEGLP